MTTTAGGSDSQQPDEMHVVHPRAAGLPFRQPAGGCLTPIPSLAHLRRWRGTAPHTDRG